MLFMIIEHFHEGRTPDVYRRFRDRGRMAPEALRYISSWVDLRFERCFQLNRGSAPDPGSVARGDPSTPLRSLAGALCAPKPVMRLGASWLAAASTNSRFEPHNGLMEADDEALVREWTANWDDLIDFQIVPVRTSAEAVAVIAPQL